MQENTHTTGRDRGLDLLRTLATLRVFLWHATGFAALTFIGAIPVMFWLNGLLLAGSVSRQGMAAALYARAKRLLIPYWGFAVIVTTVMHLRERSYSPFQEILTWVLPIGDPSGALWQEGWITEPLWYLRAYTWLLILAPVLLLVLRRRPMLLLTTLLLGTFLGESLLGAGAWAVQDAVTYGFFFALGIVTASRGGISTALRRAAGIFAAAGAVALWRIEAPLDGVVNNSHRLHLLVGIATLALVQEFRGILRRAADALVLGDVVNFMRERSLTFYLWHAPLTGLAWVGTARLGIDNAVVNGVVAVTAGLLGAMAACVLLGALEDLSAGRRRLQLPELRVAGAATLTLVALVTTLALPDNGEAALPPTPSRTPELADYTIDAGESFLLGPTQSARIEALGTVDRSPTSAAGMFPVPGVREGAGRAGSKHDKVAAPIKTPVRQPVAGTPALGLPARGATPPVATWADMAPPISAEKADLINQTVANWLKAKPTVGVEVVVVAPGRYRYVSGYAEDGTTKNPADRIAIHSITKTFTAALILRAVEDGRIRLEDKLGTLDVAPWFTLGAEITIGQLLSHKSGLVTYTDTAIYKSDWQKIDGWEPALRGAQEEGLAFTPGSKQVYSSTNFIVLGLLAAEIYGVEIEKLIERDLLTPLGLDRTGVGMPQPGSPGTGTGNMTAHITDLARWANAMWRERTVLGAYGNQLTTYVDPVNMLGYGNFTYCPCQKQNGKTLPAAIGGNGAESTMRYYAGIDTIIVLRTPVNGPLKGIEELVTEILRIANS